MHKTSHLQRYTPNRKFCDAKERRNSQMLAEYCAGSTFEQIADKHELSVTAVNDIIHNKAVPKKTKYNHDVPCERPITRCYHFAQCHWTRNGTIDLCKAAESVGYDHEL